MLQGIIDVQFHGIKINGDIASSQFTKKVIIGARCARPTLVVKTENCLYICMYIYIYKCLFGTYASMSSLPFSSSSPCPVSSLLSPFLLPPLLLPPLFFPLLLSPLLSRSEPRPPKDQQEVSVQIVDNNWLRITSLLALLSFSAVNNLRSVIEQSRMTLMEYVQSASCVQ